MIIPKIIAVINMESTADMPGGGFYDNLAFAFCEMSEQTQGTRETKRQVQRLQGGERLNSSQLAPEQNPSLF